MEKERLHRLVLLLCCKDKLRIHELAQEYSSLYGTVVTAAEVRSVFKVSTSSDADHMCPPPKYLQLFFDSMRKCMYTWMPTEAAGYIIGAKGEGVRFFRNVFHVTLYFEKTTEPMQRVLINTHMSADYVRVVVLPVIRGRMQTLAIKLRPCVSNEPEEDLSACLPSWLLSELF